MTTDLTALPNLPADAELAPLLQESHAQSTRAQEAAAPLLAYDPATLTPEQDQQLADYLVRARRTLEQLRERRAPLTRALDAVRTALVALESPLDPRKTDSLVQRLQATRDAAARRRLEEAAAAAPTEPVAPAPAGTREGYAVTVTHPQAFVALLALYVEREQPTVEKLHRLRLDQLTTWAERLAAADGEVLEVEGLHYVWHVRTVAR